MYWMCCAKDTDTSVTGGLQSQLIQLFFSLFSILLCVPRSLWFVFLSSVILCSWLLGGRHQDEWKKPKTSRMHILAGMQEVEATASSGLSCGPSSHSPIIPPLLPLLPKSSLPSTPSLAFPPFLFFLSSCSFPFLHTINSSRFFPSGVFPRHSSLPCQSTSSVPHLF